MAIEIPHGSPKDILALIERIMAEPAVFSEEFENITFGDWAKIHVYLPKAEDSAITAPFMEAFVELQRQIYQIAALAKSGVADTGQLSELDRLELLINVKVSGGGSSNYLADLPKPLQELLKRMIGKMTGQQAVIVILGIGALIAAPYSFSAWLEQRRAVQIEELKSKDHIAALNALQFSSEEHTKVFERITGIVEQQGEIGRRAIEVLNATNEALLKAASKTPEARINEVELTKQSAELLRVTPKKKPEVKIVIQRMKVVDINTADPIDLQIVLMDPDTGAQHRMKFRDNLFAGPDREKLFGSLDARQPIWVELAVKELDGEIKSVQLLRCVERPAEISGIENNE